VVGVEPVALDGVVAPNATATAVNMGTTPSLRRQSSSQVYDAKISEGLGGQLYDLADRGNMPADALAASLGCGNPLAVADLHEDHRVLDLGSGGGIDVLLSARRVGPPTGKAYGLDMTDEMLTLVRVNAHRAGATNVETSREPSRPSPCPTAPSTSSSPTV
jgi:SAM-dependent methyltransferase